MPDADLPSEGRLAGQPQGAAGATVGSRMLGRRRPRMAAWKMKKQHGRH